MARPKRKFVYFVDPPDSYDTDQLTKHYKNGSVMYSNYKRTYTFDDAAKWARKMGIGAIIRRRYLIGKHKGREHVWDYVGFKK